MKVLLQWPLSSTICRFQYSYSAQELCWTAFFFSVTCNILNHNFYMGVVAEGNVSTAPWIVFLSLVFLPKYLIFLKNSGIQTLNKWRRLVCCDTSDVQNLGFLVIKKAIYVPVRSS